MLGSNCDLLLKAIIPKFADICHGQRFCTTHHVHICYCCGVVSTFRWTCIFCWSFTNGWIANITSFISSALMCSFFSLSVHKPCVFTLLQCAPQPCGIHMWWYSLPDLDWLLVLISYSKLWLTLLTMTVPLCIPLTGSLQPRTSDCSAEGSEILDAANACIAEELAEWPLFWLLVSLLLWLGVTQKFSLSVADLGNLQ